MAKQVPEGIQRLTVLHAFACIKKHLLDMVVMWNVHTIYGFWGNMLVDCYRKFTKKYKKY